MEFRTHPLLLGFGVRTHPLLSGYEGFVATHCFLLGFKVSHPPAPFRVQGFAPTPAVPFWGSGFLTHPCTPLRVWGFAATHSFLGFSVSRCFWGLGSPQPAALGLRLSARGPRHAPAKKDLFPNSDGLQSQTPPHTAGGATCTLFGCTLARRSAFHTGILPPIRNDFDKGTLPTA